jgi:hypothetical protein
MILLAHLLNFMTPHARAVFPVMTDLKNVLPVVQINATSSYITTLTLLIYTIILLKRLASL